MRRSAAYDRPDMLQNACFSWEALPAVTAHLPGTGGSIRTSPDDFVVVEIPSYLPSGEGAHAYAHVEKRGLTTQDIVSALADAGVPRSAVGYAGQKDKHSVARQWFSVPVAHEHAIDALRALDGASVLHTSRHRNKLGLGHLRGNQFTVRVRNPVGDWQPRAERILAHLRTTGLPNYFGPQRFGSFNTNVSDALRLIAGERVPGGRRMRRFYLSALQSHIFNLLLKARIDAGLYDAILSGDRAQRHDSGGMFVVDDPAAETERARRLEISPVLPMYGKKVRPSDGDAGEIEARIMADLGMQHKQLSSVRGTRRISRIRIDDATIAPTDDGYTLAFSLPKGVYATTLIRELSKTAVH